MKKKATQLEAEYSAEMQLSEFLILPDGRILAHNLTPETARLLAELNPADEAMRCRAASAKSWNRRDSEARIQNC